MKYVKTYILYNVKVSAGYELPCPETYIIRKLTPEEIEQFEFESNTNKYNL